MVHVFRAVSELHEDVFIGKVHAAVKDRIELLLWNSLKLLPCVDPGFFNGKALDGQRIIAMVDPIYCPCWYVLGSD